jgi:hypothetical protein
MARFAAVDRSSAPVLDDHPLGHPAGGLGAARLLSPGDYRLWLAEIELRDGGWLEVGGPAGEALYLFGGELAVDGRVCPTGGAVVVEPGVTTRVVATGPVRVAHFGSRGDGPPVETAHRGVVHVIGPGGSWTSGRLEDVDAVWFTDSTCETCRIALFMVSSREAHRGPSHSHSEDEIIFLVDGSVRMGAHRYGPGTALSIPGGVRYAFEGVAGGHRFLNFRTGVSYQTSAGRPPLLETAATRDGTYVGDVR